MTNKLGWIVYGPGETLLFSVTNKKIYRYVGKAGKPITVNFSIEKSDFGFSDGN